MKIISTTNQNTFFSLKTGTVISGFVVFTIFITLSTGSFHKFSSNDPDVITEREIQAEWKKSLASKSLNLHCTADVNSGSVIVSGTVETESLRINAIQLAQKVNAELLITDKIIVSSVKESF